MKNWVCPKCKRIFQKKGQVHSCKVFPKKKHFENKEHAKELYTYLHTVMNKKAGKCREISLPCCIHWFGTYDFIALLPKKDHLEIRFALDRKLTDSRITHCVPLSKHKYKNCLNVYTKKEIDKKLLKWLRESYKLKS